ncbi:uncharacterized protein [Pleurodeles waltl]|uniref:uncharacterized protein isoform X2 n=1 Tax=Pleurodeles waltl TaxID=8319 RepID=UPI003709664E
MNNVTKEKGAAGVNSNSIGTVDNRKFKITHVQKNTQLPNTKCGNKRVNSNSIGTVDNRKFKITYVQRNTQLPNTKCGSKILRKRSSPYDTWLTSFESTKVNCQIIDLTSPMPTVIAPPATKAAARTTTKAATTRREATDIKLIPTTKKKPQVAVTEEESRLYYLPPFVPFRSYIPTIRHHEVPYYIPQYGSYFPFYHSGYYPSFGPETYYNLLLFGSTLRDGSSEEDG